MSRRLVSLIYYRLGAESIFDVDMAVVKQAQKPEYSWCREHSATNVNWIFTDKWTVQTDVCCPEFIRGA